MDRIKLKKLKKYNLYILVVAIVSTLFLPNEQELYLFCSMSLVFITLAVDGVFSFFLGEWNASRFNLYHKGKQAKIMSITQSVFSLTILFFLVVRFLK